MAKVLTSVATVATQTSLRAGTPAVKPCYPPATDRLEMTMSKKETLELKLPEHQIAYINAIAKLAGVSTNSAASVLIAIQFLAAPYHPTTEKGCE